MRRKERQRYEMFLSVGDFETAHRAAFVESPAVVKAFAAVAAAAAKIDAESSTVRVVAGAGLKAKAAARAALKARLARIMRTSRLVGRTDPDPAGMFVLPKRKGDRELLAAAQGFIASAKRLMARLRPYGLSDTVVAELREHADALREATKIRDDGVFRARCARVGLAMAMAEGMRAVHTLDIVVTNILQDDPAAVALWKRSRHLDWSQKQRPNVVPPMVDAPPPE